MCPRSRYLTLTVDFSISHKNLDMLLAFEFLVSRRIPELVLQAHPYSGKNVIYSPLLIPTQLYA